MIRLDSFENTLTFFALVYRYSLKNEMSSIYLLDIVEIYSIDEGYHSSFYDAMDCDLQLLDVTKYENNN